MRKIVLFLALVLASCGDLVEENKDYSLVASAEKEAWICHNPESDLHGSLCREVVDSVRGKYETCHWILDGSNYGRGTRIENSFCWLLEKKDCSGELRLQWQKDNCHFFEASQ